MRYKYYFCDRFHPQIINFLESRNIRYKVSGEGSRLSLVVFNLWSSDTNIESHLQELERMNVRRPIVFAEYSAPELSNAQLIWVTPKKQCIEITNSQEAYHRSCRWTNAFGVPKVAHKEQIGLFSIAKEPSVKTRTAFWCESTGFGEVFTDYRVQDLAYANSLVGIDFKNVILRDGCFSAKIYQMSSKCIITQDCIAFGHGERKMQCDICGKPQFYIDNAYQLHLVLSKIKPDNDLYITERIFGEGTAYPLYLISQRFYQLIKSNKLESNLSFSPVADII